ncbi:hypothetical protein ZIOFF_000861 [Zingiber officinale]|uniref:Retrovirus-related Pol polyprotein from transposon TNT 1-94-like beta-barrel domain-containing protein n=1 Tax=Zingiber officinale TaxID=94328 RepID=A0A8J5M821_ZINOF|nr:hypothetical protein ZIOFF_000861 [Zingiber officinale]
MAESYGDRTILSPSRSPLLLLLRCSQFLCSKPPLGSFQSSYPSGDSGVSCVFGSAGGEESLSILLHKAIGHWNTKASQCSYVVVREETWEAFVADSLLYAKAFLFAIALVINYSLALCYLVAFLVQLAIDDKGKLEYLNGEIKPPTTKDPRFKQWRSQNSMVTAWLINSMDPVIGKPFIFLPIARDVWEAELDLFEEEDWENPNDSSRYKKKIERGPVFVFLAGLNKELDEGPLLQFVVQNLKEIDKESKGLGVTIAENRGTLVKTAGSCMENQHMGRGNRAVITSIVPIGTLACTKSNDFWILDSGATDHMTGISQYFSSYTPSAGNQKIKIADGSFATIAGKGKGPVPISQSITVKDVLHDLTSRKMIGDAKQDVIFIIAQQPPYDGLGDCSQLTPLQLESLLTEGNTSKFWLVEFRALCSSTYVCNSRIFPDLSVIYSNKNISFGIVDIGHFPNAAEKFGISLPGHIPTYILFENAVEIVRLPEIGYAEISLPKISKVFFSYCY